MSTKETPKTDAPKTDSNPFAANPFAGFDPMTAWTNGQQAFAQMFAESQQRMASFANEYAALEAQMFTKMQAAVANWAQLANEAIAYSAQLSAQARKMGLETAKKFGTTVGA